MGKEELKDEELQTGETLNEEDLTEEDFSVPAFDEFDFDVEEGSFGVGLWDTQEGRTLLEELSDLAESDEMKEAAKKDEDAAKKNRKEMRRVKKEYEEGKVGRAELEAVYTDHMGLIYHMAKRFHPLSAYGRDMIRQAIASRKRFEDTAGALITRITDENIEAFEPVLSEDITEEILTGQVSAIGSLRASEDGVYGVGAVCYSLENSEVDGSIVLRIKWLYVDEDYREQGIGNSLMGELANIIIVHKIPAISIEIARTGEEGSLERLAAEWSFEMEEGLDRDFLCRLSDISRQEEMQKLGKNAKSISKAEGEEAKAFVKRAVAGTQYELEKKAFIEKDGYMIPELSFYTGNQKSPDTIILTHRKPSGMLRSECLLLNEEKQKDFASLICAVALEAYYTEPKETLISMPIESEEFGELLDGLFPLQQAETVVEGVLISPVESQEA